MIITEIKPCGKGKYQVSFDLAEEVILYKGEMRMLGLEEHMTIDNELFEQMYYEIVGKRAVKRAMHLLERMDRTEEQLRRKLTEGKYPQELIDRAIEYVESYHYIDDERYAHTFVRLNQERRSIGRMRMDLLSRGISQELVECALEEENETSQEELIKKFMEKKHYDSENATITEKKRIYQFLLRKGFRCEEIMRVLRVAE